MKRIDVLIATMNQKNFDFLKGMNIQTNTIIANQDNIYKYEEINFGSNTHKMITTPYRGVGKNRNIAIYASSADYCIIADDDIKYVDNYEKLIFKAFEELDDADIIIFNLMDCNDKGRRQNKKIKRLKWYNLLNYGAVRITFKRESIIRNSLSFSLSFGGGAPYSAGEDSLFLLEAYKRKLKIYVYPETLLELKEAQSTWFRGYSEKYYYDKGKFISMAFPCLKWIMLLVFFVKEIKNTNISHLDCFRNLCKGALAQNKNNMFDEVQERRNLK